MIGFKSIKNSLNDSQLVKNQYVNKYKIFFIPLATLSLGILITALVTIPQLLKLFETSKTIDELNLKKAFYQQKDKELKSIDQELFRQQLDTALIALPVEKDIPGVMGELLVSLGGSGMHLDGITFSASPLESEQTQEYAITLDVSGDEVGLRNFLERVTVTPRLIKLTTIEVTKNTGKSISASVTFATFYQLLPKSIGSVDDKLPQISQLDTQILADIRYKIATFPKVTTTASGSAVGKLDPFRP